MGSQGHSYILVLNGDPDEVTSKVFENHVRERAEFGPGIGQLMSTDQDKTLGHWSRPLTI